MTTLHAVPDDADGPRYTAMEVCALAGVTYRCLDHWTRRGHLDDKRPETEQRQGYPRTYTGAELDTVRLVRHLIAEGFTVPAAFRIARQVVEHDSYEATVADIFTLSVAVRDTTAPPTEGDRP